MELANFLRTRREQLNPAQLGLINVKRRRTPGLRREELSQLAGVSVSWYTWLEQGRPISVSDQVLESIARILRLDWTERRYLFRLARKKPTTETVSHISPELQSFLDSFGLCPAYIFDQSWNLIAGNQSACKVFTDDTFPQDYTTLSSREKNIIWSLFTLPSRKKLLPDWENEAKRCVALFRFSSDQYVGEPWYTEFIDDLKSASPHFREWWTQHDIQAPHGICKTLNHPVVGRLVLQATTLLIPGSTQLQMMVYTPLPKEDTSNKLARLVNL